MPARISALLKMTMPWLVAAMVPESTIAAADGAAVRFDAGRGRDGSGVDDAAIEVTDGIAGTESGRMKAKPYACAARRDGASISNAACKRIGKNHDPG